ncbi:MAG: AAA family ATPase [Sphingobacteriaceae bacterium]
MYKSIKIDSPEFNAYSFTGKNYLTNLSKINIFIGQNSSGKSQLMRTIFSASSFEFLPLDVNIVKLNHLILNFKLFVNDYLNHNGFAMSSFLEQKLRPIELLDFKFTRFQELETFMQNINNAGAIVTTGRMLNMAVIYNDIQPRYSQFIDEFKKLIVDDRQTLISKRIYIPVLRGLRSLDIVKNTLLEQIRDDRYLQRTKVDYFKSIDSIEHNIFTGLDLYYNIRGMLLGDYNQRKLIKEFEEFLSETFFNGQSLVIIPREGEDVLFLKIGDDDDLPIYKLGDGIQSLIILTYQLYINKGKNMCFFFEEPDLFLHPGFQRVFIETLCKKEFESFQYFFTTHSNHFLDMTLDFEKISVYSFKKIGQMKFEVNNVKNDDLNLLKELGVRNSSVFLTNCTIWVEGISDRIYIRKFLHLFQDKKISENNSNKRYLEDLHYSFVEYAGNNITHWSFLEDAKIETINVEKLCGELFLITDSDEAGYNENGKASAKLVRQEELKKTLGDRYYCLKCREMENLITFEILKKAIETREGGNASNLDFSEVKDFSLVYLGKYIEEKVKNLKYKYQSQSNSGTIRNKVEFANLVCAQINNFDELSEEAQDLTKKIYSFIEKKNS